MSLIRLFQFIIVMILILVFMLVPRKGIHRVVWGQICNLVGEKFFRSDLELQNWRKRCDQQQDKISLWWSREHYMQAVQYLLDDLQVSHLMIYNPSEDRRLWRGEAVDTGLRVRLIEGRLVVYAVLAKSPADVAQIKVGDELLKINGEIVRSAWGATINEGLFEFQRGAKTLNVFLQPKVLTIDHGPLLQSLTEQTAWLEIPSFRAEYFKVENWRKIAVQLPQYKKIIVDLRRNSGGNLIAMLRALSPFFCRETLVGKLSQPRRSKALGSAPVDNLDELEQLALLEKYREVPLKTFTTYGCVTAPVTVLIDGSSASVSEIFAQAMLSRPQTRVWGQPSAGDVVLATWYGLPLLGYGYSLSIPEALYLTMSGDSLEGGGVWPQQQLNYELNEALAGKDSWLLRAQDP